MNAVITVDQSVEDQFADGDERIFRLIGPAAVFIHYNSGFDVSPYKVHCAFQHLRYRSVKAFVVDKAFSGRSEIADLISVYDHSGDAELREKRLGIIADKHQPGDGRLAVIREPLKFHDSEIILTCELRLFRF